MVRTNAKPSNIKILLTIVAVLYFAVDVFVGFAYYDTCQKISKASGQFYHYSMMVPGLAIPIYKWQMELFKTLPGFEMQMFWDSLTGNFIVLGLVIVLTMGGIYVRR